MSVVRRSISTGSGLKLTAHNRSSIVIEMPPAILFAECRTALWRQIDVSAAGTATTTTHLPALPAGAEAMRAKTIHSMIRVLDEQRTVAFYHKAFGLVVSDRFSVDNSTIVYLRNQQSPFEIELTINAERSEPYNTGDGYGHLAVRVDDLDDEHNRMSREGLEPGEIKELDLGGNARFFFLKDPDGYQIEVLGPTARFKDL